MADLKSYYEMRKRLLILSLGLALALLGLEGSLRLLAWQTPLGVPIDPAAASAFPILCLGNSYTAGVGGTAGHSYCQRLNELIQADPGLKEKGIRVFNLGVAGLNSAEILSRLPRILGDYKPRVVLLMAGEPNAWNLEGHSRFLTREGQPVPAPLLLFLRQSAVFKLVTQLRHLNSVKEAPEFDQLRTIPMKNSAIDQPARIRDLQAALALRPSEATWRTELFHLLRAERRYDEALALLEESATSFAERFEVSVLNQFHLLRQDLEKEGDNARLAALSEALTRAGRNALSPGDYRFANISLEERLAWIRSDLREIARLLKAQNIALVLQTYPPLRQGGTRPENQAIREVARELNLPLSDTDSFLAAAKWLKLYSSLGERDNHLNDEGYRRIGDELFLQLRDLKLLPN